MATDYLARHGLSEVACRFDIVAIDGDASSVRVTVIRDAWIL
jgi:Holliday junction resolvase-like predicted endonuclease